MLDAEGAEGLSSDKVLAWELEHRGEGGYSPGVECLVIAKDRPYEGRRKRVRAEYGAMTTATKNFSLDAYFGLLELSSELSHLYANKRPKKRDQMITGTIRWGEHTFRFFLMSGKEISQKSTVG